jgi:hypothetical protein
MLGATDLGTRSVPGLLSTSSHFLRANWSEAVPRDPEPTSAKGRDL